MATKRVKFEIHIKVGRGVKATKASLIKAVKAWIDDEEMPAGYEVSVIRWKNDNHAWKEDDDPDQEREWLGRLLPWADLQIQTLRADR